MVEDTEARATAGRRRALGRAVRRYRQGLTQGQLAALLGVSQASVSSWELGGVALTCEQVAAIEAVLRLPAGSLLVEAGYLDADVAGADAVRLVALRRLEDLVEALRACSASGPKPWSESFFA